MIEESYVNQIECIPNSAGDELIRLAGLGHAGRVIVSQNYGCCIACQSLFDDFTRVNGCSIYGAAEQFVEGQHPVAIIEKQAAEYLVRPVTQARQQKLRAIDRAGDVFAGSQFFP